MLCQLYLNKVYFHYYICVSVCVCIFFFSSTNRKGGGSSKSAYERLLGMNLTVKPTSPSS